MLEDAGRRLPARCLSRRAGHGACDRGDRKRKERAEAQPPGERQRRAQVQQEEADREAGEDHDRDDEPVILRAQARDRGLRPRRREGAKNVGPGTTSATRQAQGGHLRLLLPGRRPQGRGHEGNDRSQQVTPPPARRRERREAKGALRRGAPPFSWIAGPRRSRSVGIGWLAGAGALRASRPEPAADRARRARARSRAERDHRRDRRGQDDARARARPAAGRQAEARHRPPGRRRGLRRGRVHAARRASRRIRSSPSCAERLPLDARRGRARPPRRPRPAARAPTSRAARSRPRSCARSARGCSPSSASTSTAS